MKKVLWPAALTLVVALLACQTRPTPTHEAVLADSLPAETVIPGAWATAAQEGRVPDGWLRTFQDPGLEAVVGEALRNNLDLRGAGARLDAAASAARLAGASLEPVVSASGAAQGRSTAGGERLDQRGVGLNLSWELDLWGRVRAQAEGAQAAYEGASLDYEFARQSIAAAAAKAWFLAIETLQQERILAEQVEAAVETLRVLRARRAAGKVNEQEERLASADLASAQERHTAAVTAHQQVQRALETLLGRYPSGELAAAEDLPPMPGPVPTGVPSELLERRPDVAAAERRVRAAFKGLETMQLARLPRIQLTAAVGSSSQLSGLTGNGGFFDVGANFFAPILDGGAMRANVEIATAEQEASLAAYGRTALAAFQDVENALASESSLAVREEHLAAAVRDDEEALRLRQLEAQAGKVDTLSVLQLRRQVNAARSGLITLRQARRTERVNLHLALGGSFE
jgi:outer membrane protein, multidrug efflux system